MLTATFSHIEGISVNFEKQLFDAGIKHWDDFLDRMHLLTDLSKPKIEKIKNSLFASKEALQNEDFHYFKNILKPKEHWRLCKMGKVAYVDIETTGLF